MRSIALSKCDRSQVVPMVAAGLALSGRIRTVTTRIMKYLRLLRSRAKGKQTHSRMAIQIVYASIIDYMWISFGSQKIINPNSQNGDACLLSNDIAVIILIRTRVLSPLLVTALEKS